jgi:hypothetical protein
MISNSEYCSDSLSDLKWNYTFDEFIKLTINVQYYDDLKKAAEMDSKNKAAFNKLARQSG